MHSRNTTAADALHQAAVNTKNTNNLPTDLRHAHLQPTTGTGTGQSTTGTTGTTGTTSGPVFHEQPREQLREQPRETMPMSSGSAAHQQPRETMPMSSGYGGQSKTTMTVESVARDAEAQIDAQVAEALAKSRQLNAQDQARLQSSIGSATSNLEEQARQLKAQIDEEKLRAEQHVKRAQQEKLSATTQRQNMEEKAILEAAAARKIELEQKSMKLQQEIDEITRRKTAEMMGEKPGNLQFIHQHQDTGIAANLAGDIGHALDVAQSGRITETTTGGDVQYHPVKVQTMPTQATQQARAAEQTVSGPAVHQQHGGVLHAMKTFVTGESTSGTSGTATTTGMKQAPVQGTRAYDEQSQWANQSDKLASK